MTFPNIHNWSFGVYYLKQNQENKMREGSMTPSTY